MVNVAHCVTSVIFISFFQPYHGRLTNVASMYSEWVTLGILSLCASFEFDYSKETSDAIMWGGIAMIYSIMLVNFIDIFYS